MTLLSHTGFSESTKAPKALLLAANQLTVMTAIDEASTDPSSEAKETWLQHSPHAPNGIQPHPLSGAEMHHELRQPPSGKSWGRKRSTAQ